MSHFLKPTGWRLIDKPRHEDIFRAGANFIALMYIVGRKDNGSSLLRNDGVPILEEGRFTTFKVVVQVAHHREIPVRNARAFRPAVSVSLEEISRAVSKNMNLRVPGKITTPRVAYERTNGPFERAVHQIPYRRRLTEEAHVG